MPYPQPKPLAEVRVGDYRKGFKNVYEGNDFDKAREVAEKVKKTRKQFVLLVFEGQTVATRY